MIRHVTIEDSDFLISLAKESYTLPFVEEAAREWIARVVAAPDEAIFIRTDNATGVSVIQRPAWAPHQLEAHMVFLVSRGNGVDMEGYKILKAMIEWAREQGASFHFGEQTGIDFAPFAKRLGAVPDRVTYTIEA